MAKKEKLMAIDKLRYESQNVSIAREVQKYPKHLGIREVIQNSIEGDGKTGASDIQILSLQTQASELTGNAPKLARTVQNNTTIRNPSLALKSFLNVRLGYQMASPVIKHNINANKNGSPLPSS